MKINRQRGVSCLLVLVAAVGLPCFLVWHGLRQERLSAQLLATVKDLPSDADITYDAEDEKSGQGRERVKQRTLQDEAKAVRLLQEGADPNVRDFAAVKRTFWQEMKFLLQRFLKRPSAAGPLPRSALAIAVKADNAVIVTALLKAGANDVNAETVTYVDGLKFPLVNYGAYNGNYEIVGELCAHGADIHKFGESYVAEGEPILQTVLSGSNRYHDRSNEDEKAAEVLDRKHRTEIFHLLLTKGERYEPNSKTGHLLLLAAAEGSFLEITRELLDAGVPVRARPEWIDYPPEMSPLDAAVSNDHIALMQLLLERGAPTRDPNSEPPILSVQSPEAARLLLKYGADIQATQPRGKHQGENVLNFACETGNAKTVAFLIAHGLDVNKNGPIGNAALYGNAEIVRLLLQHGAKVSPKSPGEDALWMAITDRHFDSALLILRAGADVNSKEEYPLTEAVAQESAEVALALLKRGAKVNAGKGEALIAACESCDEDMVEMLLEYGADPTVRSSDGTTALEVAKQNADPIEDADAIIALLKDYGAKK
jgi:ankyrin repeat protein